MSKTDPIFEEIEEIFDKFTESDILKSSYVEHTEVVASNLLIAYALLKTRRVSVITRIKKWLRRNKNARD